MEAEAFHLIREQKDLQGYTWNELAELINRRYGLSVTGDRVKEFVHDGKIPWGGFLVRAIEEALKIPPRAPEKYKSFKVSEAERELD